MAAYDNPYPNYYEQPSFDNPNSLYTSTGQVISNQQLPTPTGYDQNPFQTPLGPQPHPSLYNDGPALPVSSSAASARYSDAYGGANELGFAQRPSSTVNPDRYNSPAPLPGQSQSQSPPIGRRRVQLSDNPASLAPGFPPGSRSSRYGDPEGDGGDASEMALLGPLGGGGGGHGGDRLSVGGFKPDLVDEDGESNIRWVFLSFLWCFCFFFCWFPLWWWCLGIGNSWTGNDRSMVG